MIKTNSRPLVSILMPVYNGGETFHIAMTSLLIQTLSDWEAIVVDDGSTDSLFDHFLTEDPRFKLVRHKLNRGRGAARQTALDHAIGKYIAYLDCDDFYHPEKLLRQIDFLERHSEISCMSCGVGCFDEYKRLRRVRPKLNCNGNLYTKGERLPFVLAASVIRSCVAKRIEYDTDRNFGEDTDYSQRALQGKLYGSVPEILYYYGEYGSVTPRKIALSHWTAAKHALSSSQNPPLSRASQFSISSAKAALVFLGAPLLPKDFLLDIRGQQPITEEVTEFERVKALVL